MNASKGIFKRFAAILTIPFYLIMIRPYSMADLIANEPNNLLAFRHISSEWLTDADGYEFISFDTFPGNIRDEVRDIAADLYGNIYLTGSSAMGDDDIVTVKYDPNGIELRTARYDGPDQRDDFPEVIVVDADQNVYVAGSTDVSGQSYCDYQV